MPNHAPISFSGSVLLGLMLTLNNAAVGQTGQKPVSRPLEPGVSLERSFTGGESHLYRVALRANQYANVQIVKQGVNVIMGWQNPSGELLFTANFEALEQGIEAVCLIAKTEGVYTLIVQSDLEKAPPGRYQVTLTELRMAGEPEQQRFTAQLAFVEATQLHKQGTPAARQQAREKLLQALPLWQSLGDREWEARTLFWLGWNDFWLAQPDRALASLNQALALRRAAQNNIGVAEVLRTIGLLHTAKGQWKDARDLFQQALELQRGTTERWQLGFTLTELGKIYWRLGEQEKSDAHFDEGGHAFHTAGDEAAEAVTLTTRSTIAVSQGDYQTALDSSARVLPFFRAAKDIYSEAGALNVLGMAYYNLGEPQQALEQLRQSLQKYQTIQDRQQQVFVLTNMGLTESALGNKRQALVTFGKARQLLRANPALRGEENLLRHIGRVYQELGEQAQALENLNESLRLAQAHGELGVQANALTTLGEVYAAQGDHQRSMDSLNLALSLQRKMRNRQGEAVTLLTLARVERRRGDLAQAQTQAEAALRLIETLREKVTGTELRTSYLAAYQGYYEQYIDLLMLRHEQAPNAGYEARALQAREQARARALLDSLIEARANIRQGVDPALLEREQTLQKQLITQGNRLRQLLSGKSTPEQTVAADRAVETSLAEYQQVQAQIRASSPRYAAITQPQPLSLAEIQAQLDDETLLLVYSLGTQRSFLWAVTPTTAKSYVLPAREEIKSLAEQVYQSLQISHQRTSQARADLVIRQLSHLLLKPLAGQLTQRRLVIVADGVLQYIPFAALFTPGSTERLMAKHEIIYLPSVSSLSQLRQDLAGRQLAPKTMAVIADPVFEAADKRFNAQLNRKAATVPSLANPLTTATRAAKEIGRTGFARLLYSQQEAEQITSLIPPTLHTKLLGFDASRATLAATDLSQYRLLHFATHSLIHPKTPELSGIVLSLYDRERRPQDGFLRAHEIYNLKLNAELVVLSACQTAIGKEVRGEGLIGLSRGFMYAGAPRLIVSLWKVNDQATAELMQRFYRGMLKDNLRPAAALRAAQAEMARATRWAAPHYWAGFILQGEWR